MDKIKIRFKVNGNQISREIDTPIDSHNVICDLFREFDDFTELNFFQNGEWVYGATYDSRK